MTRNEILHHPAVKTSMLCNARRMALLETVEALRPVEGSFCEFGSGRGGSYALMRLTDPQRHIACFESFSGLPEPADEDSGGVSTIGACRFSEDEFFENLEVNGIRLPLLHTGDVMKTVPKCLPGKIAFAFVDLDLFRATEHILKNIMPRVAHRGIILVDDYSHRFPGVIAAVISSTLGQSGWDQQLIRGEPDNMILFQKTKP